jgi:hypothetical protein
MFEVKQPAAVDSRKRFIEFFSVAPGKAVAPVPKKSVG